MSEKTRTPGKPDPDDDRDLDDRDLDDDAPNLGDDIVGDETGDDEPDAAVEDERQSQR
jgi:hypothetical protein